LDPADAERRRRAGGYTEVFVQRRMDGAAPTEGFRVMLCLSSDLPSRKIVQRALPFLALIARVIESPAPTIAAWLPNHGQGK
jgi:hypothetical protein